MIKLPKRRHEAGLPKDAGLPLLSRKKKIGLAVLTAVAGVAGYHNFSLFYDTSPAPAEEPRFVTPEERRAEAAKAIALPFDACRIVSIVDQRNASHKSKAGTSTTLTIGITAPVSSQAAAIRKQHQADKSLTWTPPVGVGVVLDSAKPNTISPIALVPDDNKKGSSDINNGTGEFKLFPLINAKPGTRVGVYVMETVQSDANGHEEEFAGFTPCGEVVKDGSGTWIDNKNRNVSMVPEVVPIPPGYTLQQTERAVIPS